MSTQPADEAASSDREAEFEEESSAVPRLSKKGWTLVTLGLLALIGITAWVAVIMESKPVRWKDVGFSVVSPTEAIATYDVYLYGDAGATCTVRALNSRFTEVGVATQRIERADGAEQRLRTTVITTEEATTALVQGCVADG